MSKTPLPFDWQSKIHSNEQLLRWLHGARAQDDERKAEAIRAHLLERNVAFVRLIVHRHFAARLNQYNFCLEMEDLLNAGMEGMAKAIERHDAASPYKLTAFAASSIVFAVHGAIKRARTRDEGVFIQSLDEPVSERESMPECSPAKKPRVETSLEIALVPVVLAQRQEDASPVKTPAPPRPAHSVLPDAWRGFRGVGFVAANAKAGLHEHIELVACVPDSDRYAWMSEREWEMMRAMAREPASGCWEKTNDDDGNDDT